MLFSSMEFLFLFFPITLGICYILPRGARNYWLLLASLFFYAWGEPRFVIIMIASIVLNYFAALGIEKHAPGSRARTALLVAGITVDLGLLFVFKYLNFAISTLHTVAPSTGAYIHQTYIALPIGISFFTFQMLSYIIDVYRGIPAQRNIAYLGLYISFFPQLIAGPIVRYTTVMDEIMERRATREDFVQGALRFLYGLSKKMLLANVLAELVHYAFSAADPSVCFAWLGSVAYTLQIYFDFSGYSDMAIGMGRMFGFHFLENFDYPYMSRSVSEFWRRWHISLGSWFRDYVYIPLGGNRVSRLRHLFNIFVVWMLTGFWHGAAWNFIVWGLFFAVLLMVEKLWLLKYLKKSRVLSHIYVVILIIISFVIFDASSMGQAFSYIGSMFGAGGYPLVSTEFLYYFRSYGVVLILGIIGATPLPKKLWNRIAATNIGSNIMTFAEPIALSALLLCCSAYLVDGSYNPFLYFRF